MAVASARGRLKGKRPKLSSSQQQHFLKLYDADEKTIPELAELFSVSRATVYRVPSERKVGMRSQRLALSSLAVAATIAAPGGTLAAEPAESVTTALNPTVHVTPDRIAEIPVYLRACTDAKTCDAPIALYTRRGRRLTDSVPAAFLPSLNQGSFPGLRLTPAAWRDLTRTHRLFTRLELRLPAGATELLGYETLLPPSAGQARWCAGVHRLAPPCNGRERDSGSPN
jgi:hypothetical protein